MKINKDGYKLISGFEGIKTKAYQDVIGIWTIGVGMTYINGKKVKQSDVMTFEEIENEFYKQIISYEDCINNNVKKPINQNQFNSLVSFVYNVGVGNFTKSTLLKLINENPNNPAIKAEFCKWDKAGGRSIAGLLRRREAEAENYFKGM